MLIWKDCRKFSAFVMAVSARTYTCALSVDQRQITLDTFYTIHTLTFRWYSRSHLSHAVTKRATTNNLHVSRYCFVPLQHNVLYFMFCSCLRVSGPQCTSCFIRSPRTQLLLCNRYLFNLSVEIVVLHLGTALRIRL